DENGGDAAAALMADHLAQKLEAARAERFGALAARAEGRVEAVRIRGEELSGTDGRGPKPVLEIAAEEPEHAGGLAVKAAPEADDLGLLRVGAGELERALDGLGAAGVELDGA